MLCQWLSLGSMLCQWLSLGSMLCQWLSLGSMLCQWLSHPLPALWFQLPGMCTIHMSIKGANIVQTDEIVRPNGGVGLSAHVYTAVDMAGNTATCQVSVMVVDKEGPVFSCPAHPLSNLYVFGTPGVHFKTTTAPAPATTSTCTVSMMCTTSLTSTCAVGMPRRSAIPVIGVVHIMQYVASMYGDDLR